MEEAKERFYHYHDDTRAAFDELCAMVDALNVSTLHVYSIYLFSTDRLFCKISVIFCYIMWF